MKKFFKKILLLVTVLYTGIASAAQVTQCSEPSCVDYFKQYKKYAKAGHADAMATLAELYLKGYGTDRNLTKALKTYRRAAKYNSVIAAAKVGMLYLTEAEIYNKDKGITYLKKAARKKHGDSAYVLGVIYSNDDFGYLDFNEADKWLNVAYQAKNKKVRRYIEYLITQRNYSANNFPKISSIVTQLNSPTKQVNNKIQYASTMSNAEPGIQWPEDEMEVITVTPPTLVEIMDDELFSFRNKFPDKFAGATGTNIIGKTCAETIACYTTSKKNFKDMLNSLDGIIKSSFASPAAFLKN